MNPMRWLSSSIDFTDRTLVLIAGGGVLAVGALTVFSVFMRYVMHAPVTWTYPVASYLLCGIIFLALADTHRVDGHVRVDYFLQIFPRRLSIAARLLGDLATTAFLVIFTQQLWKLYTINLARGRVDETVLAMPLANIQWVLPLGAFLMLLTHVTVMIRAIANGSYGQR